MRKIKRPLAVLLMFGTAFALTPTAGAQEAVTAKSRSLSAACSPGNEFSIAIKAGTCPGGTPPSYEQFLGKTEYAPGETITIRINVTLDRGCLYSEATSEGFAATTKLTQAPSGDGYRLTGTTKAIATPGTYRAGISCARLVLANQFTITTPRSPGKPKPKPPIVKPAGAPDTGGGGTP